MSQTRDESKSTELNRLPTRVDAPAAKLTVAICQMTSTDQVEANVRQIQQILSFLETQPPQLICFPENCLYMRVHEGEKIAPISINSEVLRPLSDWAQGFQSTLHLGSVPLLREGRLYNSTVLIHPDGSLTDAYQKIHLFDVDVAGHKPVRESDVFSAGAKPAVIEIAGWRIGSTICYDLRFAELFLQYARAEVDAVVIPSAFLVPTGEAHWHVLLRARAIESQCYVLAAAQGGTHRGESGGERRTFGHSMVVDPWGVVLAEAPAETPPSDPSAGVLRVELRRDRLHEVRRQIPMFGHRRL